MAGVLAVLDLQQRTSARFYIGKERLGLSRSLRLLARFERFLLFLILIVR